MRTSCLVIALALAGTAPAHADGVDTPPPPAGQPRPPAGIAVGVELGEPAALTVGWFAGRFGAVAAVGTGTLAGPGISAHLDLLVAPVVLVERPGTRVRLLVGVGVRHYRHGYEAMSVDEIPDAHTGVRVPVSIALERGAFAFYAQAAAGFDVVRTESCNFASGADSICPHAQSTRLFPSFALGTRWFFGR